MASVTGQNFLVGGAASPGSAPTVQDDGSIMWQLSGLPGGGLTLGPVVTTTPYAASASEMVRLGAGFAVTVTLPNAPPDGTTIGVKDYGGYAGPHTVAASGAGIDQFCNADGADSGDTQHVFLTVVGQAVIVRYSAVDATWCIISNDVPLSQLAAPPFSSTPVNPAGTTDTTGVMMGLAGAFLPVRTGNVLVTLCGDIYNASAIADGGTVTLYSGTGSAPANGDALIGTAFGNPVTYIAATTAEKAPFSITALVTGAAQNAPIWIDASLAAVTGGTATIENLTLTAIEV